VSVPHSCNPHEIRYDERHMSRAPLSRKEATHERIVEVAARVIRRSGYNGTGVADVMKEAGLTHGGFYAHFESREAMRFEATHDALTSVLNRGAVLAQIQNELNLSQHSTRSISLLLCDIDHFKQVNDNHGHLVGDEVLRQVSSRLSGCTRSGDLVGRYGGEEFLILLTDRDEDRSPYLGQQPFDDDTFLHRAEQIRQAVRSRPFSTEAGPLPVSVSIGAITLAPSIAAVSMELLLSLADQALYRAKAAGRDRAVFAEPLIISTFAEKQCSVPLFPGV